MIKTITPLDLINHLYNEGIKENADLDSLLLCNSQLEEDYHDLEETKLMLDKVQFNPSQNTIDAIMAYAMKPKF